jgi:hypothetical protein
VAHRNGGQAERRDAGEQEGYAAAYDAPRPAGAHVRLVGGRGAALAHLAGEHLRSGEAEQRRDEGERDEHGERDGARRRQAHRGEHRDVDDRKAREGDQHGEPGEDDRGAGRADRTARRVLAVSALKATVADPFTADAVSKDGTTAYASVTYQAESTEITDATHTAIENAAQHGRDAGLTVETGGTALQASPETGNSEVIGIGIAAVVLLITFSSLVAAGLPLLTAIMGVGVGIASITALATTLGLSSTSSTLASLIGLAVGIDYALFIVSRHRHELMRERRVRWSGDAVVWVG